jgi:hypothetical protein
MLTVTRIFSLTMLTLLSVACAQRPLPDSATAHCQHALTQLQRHIADTDSGDAQYQAIPGFPTYRSNRFWSSFATQDLSSQRQSAWRTQLHQLGMHSLQLEWRNLPADAQQAWQHSSGFAQFTDFAAQCSEALLQASLQQPLHPSATKIPDAYSTTQRVLGLYALTRFAARGAIADYQHEMRELMRQGEQTWTHATQMFTPPDANRGDYPAAPAHHSLLGVPEYTADELQTLLHWHAPRLQIEQQSGADIPGAAHWQQDARHIDPQQPTLYSFITHMRHGEQILLQLNYLAWFSERPPEQPGDWYSGALDGLIWRVTLRADGRVLFYDSIHPCGCYHSIHLPQDSPLQIPHQGDEPLLVIHTALPSQLRQPVLLVQAGTHYLLQVKAQPVGTPATTGYALKDYDELRSLPTANGRRSWFDADGLIAASARRERFYLWPLGVPSAGAMRQQGHHAIAFLGRRHFDAASVEQLLDLNTSD